MLAASVCAYDRGLVPAELTNIPAIGALAAIWTVHTASGCAVTSASWVVVRLDVLQWACG